MSPAPKFTGSDLKACRSDGQTRDTLDILVASHRYITNSQGVSGRAQDAIMRPQVIPKHFMIQTRQMKTSGFLASSSLGRIVRLVALCLTLLGLVINANAQKATRATTPAPARPVPSDVMLRIVRAEDERRWDNDLGVLLFDKEMRVRERSALAAGRIGDERSVASLVSLIQTDRESSVRAIAAFALG